MTATLTEMLKALKNRIFSRIRGNDVVRKVRDVKNFLENVAIETGIDELIERRVLVIAPHPDDESIACGGTLQAVVAAGGTVDVLFLTGGEKGFGPGRKGTAEEGEQLRHTREAEATAATRKLGVASIHWLPGVDGGLHAQDDMGGRLTAWLSAKRYDAFFCPWPFDGHSDHMATFRIFTEALARYDLPARVWLYEVWAPLLANRIVNIDAYLEGKLAAIRCYQSQITTGIDYAEKFRALAQYRSLLLPSAAHCEAFLVGDKAFALRLRNS